MRAADRPGANHPLALRMGVISFISQNLTLGCMYGSFGVLLIAVETKMSVGRALSSLGSPLVTIAIALLAPVAGTLAGKKSLRLLMMIGSALAVLGYALLAFAGNIGVNLLAYGLLIGPGVCMTGTVLPPTLVTRWFNTNRGRALGFVYIPIAMVALPLVSAFILHKYGLSTTYLMLAALMALNLIPTSFVVDFPPSAIDPTGEDEAAEAKAHPSLTMGKLLLNARFWALTLAWSSIAAGAVMLGAHLVPMATGWGISPTKAAGLLSLNALAAVAGTPVYGWIADKLGGRIAMALLCFASVILWSILFLHPPYLVLGVVVALIGLNGAACVPVFGVALSEIFGEASFGRAFGLGNTVAVPLTVASVPLAAFIYMKTGSYAGALVLQTAFFLVVGVLVLLVGGSRASQRAKGAVTEPA